MNLTLKRKQNKHPGKIGKGRDGGVGGLGNRQDQVQIRGGWRDSVLGMTTGVRGHLWVVPENQYKGNSQKSMSMTPANTPGIENTESEPVPGSLWVNSLSWYVSQAGVAIAWPLLNFCDTFTPAFLIGRANSWSKVMWLGWRPNPST